MGRGEGEFRGGGEGGEKFGGLMPCTSSEVDA